MAVSIIQRGCRGIFSAAMFFPSDFRVARTIPGDRKYDVREVRWGVASAIFLAKG